MSEILPGDAEVAFLRSEVERLTRERDEAIRQIGPLAAENERLRGALMPFAAYGRALLRVEGGSGRMQIGAEGEIHELTAGHWSDAVIAALAGEGEVHRWESVGDFIACQQCGVLRGQTSDEEVCPTPEKAREA